MADSAKLSEQIARGERAREIVNDPLVKKVFEEIESEIFTGWKITEGGDKEARENCYLLHRTLQHFKQKFETMMINGRAAETELKAQKEKSDGRG